MTSLQDQLIKAERLHEITQRVGFALWQLQELEGVTAQYFVLVVQATPGIGLESGKVLVDKAQSKTFGATITQLAKSKQLPQELEPRFKILLAERNWLVHNSRSSSRKAIHNAKTCQKLITRLENIAEEALHLLKEIGKQAESFVKRHGVTSVKIDKIAEEILKAWHSE